MKDDTDVKNVKIKNNVSSEDPSVINVKVSDVILTPLTCATLVNEIFKGLLYHKCQIPYPYNWMKRMIHKKREAPETMKKKQTNFMVSSHFRIVSEAYDILENAMNAIIEEFKKTQEPIEDIIIIFGTTPQTPKEVFSIRIFNLVEGHIERNHIPHLHKHQQNILRKIFLTQSWFDTIDTSMACMNTYIFLRKSKRDDSSNCSTNFVPARPLTFLPKLKHVKINLCSDEHLDVNCCNNFTVYDDVTDKVESVKISENSVGAEGLEKNIIWYQFKEFLKGFKDRYVNKVSTSELW